MGRQSATDLVKSINEKFAGQDSGAWKDTSKEDESRRDEARLAKLKKTEVDSYAECYPGFEHFLLPCCHFELF